MNASMHNHNTAAVAINPASPLKPGPLVAAWASSAVDAETSQPSIIQMPITIAPISAAPPGNGAPADACAITGCAKATPAPTMRIASSATSSTFVTRVVGRKPDWSSTPDAQHPRGSHDRIGKRRFRQRGGRQRERVRTCRNRRRNDGEDVGDDEHPGRVRPCRRPECRSNPRVRRAGRRVAFAQTAITDRDAAHHERDEQQCRRGRAAAGDDHRPEHRCQHERRADGGRGDHE